MVRCLFISQIQTELKHTIRGKTGWRIFKKGAVSRREHGLVKKISPFQARNEFISSNYGLFLADNTSKMFIENRNRWLMIPPSHLIDQGESPGTGSVEIPSKGDYIIKNGTVHYNTRDSSGKYVSIGETQ